MGRASDAVWDRFSGEKANWFKASDVMSAPAALNEYAHTLSWAQTQAQEPSTLWDQGEAATKQAVAQHDAIVAPPKHGTRRPRRRTTDPGEVVDTVDAADAVGDAASTATDTVGDAASTVGDAASSAWRKTLGSWC